MAGVKPSIFINYISQFKKIFVTRNNGVISQKFKIDSNISDDYYFSVVNSNNQLVSLSGRKFRMYGSIIDSKDVMHILFYSDNGEVTNDTLLHFQIDTYTSQYMAQVKTNRIIDITIVEVIEQEQQDPQEEQLEDLTQVILRDQGIAYKRPYIQNQIPAQILERVILTTNVPLTGAFGAGQDISITLGSNGAAFGTGLTQTGNNQLVIGQYNEEDATKAFIIGNGTNPSNRSNLLTIDYKGNIQTPGTISAASISISGQDFNEIVDNKLSATSGWATDTFETKTDAFNSHNTLDAKINNLSAATDEKIDAVSTAIPTKVSQLTNDLGYLTGVDLTDYATKQWVEDKNYITGYTAGSGIQINNGVISLTGQLGETYTADEDTLKLVNNQFSIKSVFPMIKSAGGVTITKDSEGVTYLKVSSGGGGGTSTEYFAGTGLELGSDPELPETTFSINTTWLAAQISAATSGLQNYSAGSGISIDANNVISVTGMVTTDQIVNMATTGWVTGYCSSFITESAIEGLATESDLQIVSAAIPTDYLVQDDLSSYVTSAALTGELDNYVLKTDLPNDIVTSGDITGFITSDWLEENGYVTTGDLNDLSTTLSSALTSNVETLSTAIDTKVTSAQVTELITGYVGQNLSAVSQLVNDTGFITLASLTGYATTGYVDEKIGQIVIPDTSTFATKSELSAVDEKIDEVSAVVSAKADKSYVDQTFLSAIPDEYVTATELATELQPYALSANVDTSIAAASGNLQTAINTKANSADVYTKTEVNTITGTLEGEITGKVAQSDFNSLCTAFSGAIDGKTTSSEVKDQIEAYNYVTETALDTALSEYTKTSELNIPTSTSQLTNNSDFITSAQVDTKIASSSAAIINGLATESYVTTAIGNTSASIIEGLATESYVGTQIANTSATIIDGLAKDEDIPLSTSELINNSDYITSGQVDTKIQNTSAAIINGLATTQYVDTVSSNLHNEITSIVIPEGTKYEAGEGLALDKSTYTFSLTATLSSITNDADFITSAQVDTKIADASGAIINGLATETYVGNQIAATSATIINGLATESYVTTEIQNTSASIINGLATESYVGTQIENTSATIINGLATESYVTSQGYQDADDVSGIVKEMSTAIRVDLATTSQLPTKTSDLTNDSEYITSSQVDTKIADTSATIINGLATETYVTTQIANTSASIIDGLASESYVTTQIQNTSATIINGLASEEYVGQQIAGTSATIINGLAKTSDLPTKTSDLTNDSQFATSANVETIIGNTSASIINGLATESYVGTQIANTSATIIDGLATESYVTSQGYQTSSDVANAINSVTGTLSTELTGWVNGQGYVTTDTTYTSGTGITLGIGNSINLNLSAATNGNIEVTTVDGVVYLSAASGGGGGTVTVDTICAMLSSANTNTLTISKSNDKIILSAAAGGGGGGGDVPETVGDLTNDVGYITISDVTNRQRIASGTTYDPAFEVVRNEYTPVDSTITLSAFTVNSADLPVSAAVGTFEEWVYTNSAVTGIALDASISGDFIGDLPTSVTSGRYYVFVRRVYNTGSSIKQYMSFAYDFEIPAD